jgi:hypothetical protein
MRSLIPRNDQGASTSATTITTATTFNSLHSPAGKLRPAPPHRRDHDGDETYNRQYQQYVEALAAVQRELNTLEARNDEHAYNVLYASSMTPLIVRCKHYFSLFQDTFTFIMRDALALARLEG